MIDMPFSPDAARRGEQGGRRGRTASTTAATSARSSTSGTARWASTRLPCPVSVAVAAWPWGTYLGDDGVANGIRLKVSSWQRHDPNAVPTAAKGTGMYVNSSLAKVEALQGRLRRGRPARGRRVGVGVHGREHLRRPGPDDRHAADVGVRRARRASPRTRCASSPTDLGYEVPRRGAHPHRPLHRRRGLPHRHRGRGRADPRGRRPPGGHRAGRAR